MNDLKQKPMFTNSELMRIIIPLVLERLTATAIGMADTIMVSSVGEAAVSAVSLADAINMVFITMFTAIATGGAVVSAQYIGNSDRAGALNSKKQLLYLLLIASLFVTVTIGVFNKQILNIMYPTLEQDVMQKAQTYLLITLLSYPFHSAMVAGTALFRSERNSKVSLFAALMSNIINLVGNAVLIYGFDMGVAGAAIATLFSRVITGIFVLYLLCDKNYEMRIEKVYIYKPDMGMIKKILGIGIPNGIENSLFSVGRLLVQGVVASLGTSAVAAYAVAMNIIGLTDCVGSGMNLSMLTVIGQCVGANDYEQATGYTRKIVGWSYMCLGVLFGTMIIICGKVVSWFNLSAEAIIMARDSLRVSCALGILAWPASFTLPCALRAAGDAKFPMVVAILSMGLFRVLFSYILGLWCGMGLVGVYLAMCLDWICRGIVFIIRFKSGKWQTKRVI